MDIGTGTWLQSAGLSMLSSAVAVLLWVGRLRERIAIIQRQGEKLHERVDDLKEAINALDREVAVLKSMRQRDDREDSRTPLPATLPDHPRRTPRKTRSFPTDDE